MKTWRIDSHQHFWKYNSNQHIWMDERMDVLKRDYLPSDLFSELKKCQLDGCVTVQASQTEAENDFQLANALDNDFIKGIVGWVDLQAADLEGRLEYYSQFQLIKGFRHVLHDEPDVDFMLRPAFLKGISSLKKYNYTYDVLVFPQHLPNVLKLVSMFPDQLFVIDHIAKPFIKDGIIDEWTDGISKIAQYPNVFCKVSGMVTEASWKQWRYEDYIPYLDVILEKFGVNRIMYGSDWPVCTLSASYSEMFSIVERYFSTLSQGDQNKVFGENAVKFYAL